jgi:hypothetical protein
VNRSQNAFDVLSFQNIKGITSVFSAIGSPVNLLLAEVEDEATWREIAHKSENCVTVFL